jgi:hypothetical protein
MPPTGKLHGIQGKIAAADYLIHCFAIAMELLINEEKTA